MRFGCSYVSIADCTCGATTIRERREQWIKDGIFAELKKIARESYDRIVGVVLEGPGHRWMHHQSSRRWRMRGPESRRPQETGYEAAFRRSARHPARPRARPREAARLRAPGPTLDKLDDIGPLPEDITVHLDAGYDSHKTRDELAGRGMTGEIAHKGDNAPIQAGQRWHVERTNAWHNSFNRLQRCYERREEVIDAFFDLADAIITIRRLVRESWTLYRWDTRPARRP